jgi:hypothetical protein
MTIHFYREDAIHNIVRFEYNDKTGEYNLYQLIDSGHERILTLSKDCFRYAEENKMNNEEVNNG